MGGVRKLGTEKYAKTTEIGRKTNSSSPYKGTWLREIIHPCRFKGRFRETHRHTHLFEIEE